MKKAITGKQDFLTDSPQAYSTDWERTQDDQPLYTGRYLVISTEKKPFEKGEKFFKDKLGVAVAHSNEFKATGLIDESAIEGADALIYDDFGIALVGIEEDQKAVLQSTASDDFIIAPEKVVYVPRDVVATENKAATWGLYATEAFYSEFTGKDVKVAVLDTGFDSQHPDFENRTVNAASFVPGENAQDKHGHGTHCIGTACGSTDTIVKRRYGVASDAVIYAGKVLNNRGSGTQSGILSGIDWAVKNGCKVISMSLSSKVSPGEGFDLAYERPARFALSRGCIVVAAAGNDSKRTLGRYAPVASPANCPSIMAVAALDKRLNIADFSNRSINDTGQIDIAAPGVDVYSSYPMPKRYEYISGTSMATPHVAGVLALLWEKYPKASSHEIANELRNLAKRLHLPSIDVGVGLSIAP